MANHGHKMHTIFSATNIKFLLTVLFFCISWISISQNEKVIRCRYSSFDFFSVKPVTGNISLNPIRFKYHDLDQDPFEIGLKERNGKRKLTRVHSDSSSVSYVCISERWGMGFDHDSIVIKRGKMISLYRWTGIDESSKYSSVLVQIIQQDSDKYQMSYHLLFDMNKNTFYDTPEIYIDTCDLTTKKQWLYEKAYATAEYTFRVRNGVIIHAGVSGFNDGEYFLKNTWPVIVPGFNPDACVGKSFNRVVLDVFSGRYCSPPDSGSR